MKLMVRDVVFLLNFGYCMLFIMLKSMEFMSFVFFKI